MLWKATAREGRDLPPRWLQEDENFRGAAGARNARRGSAENRARGVISSELPAFSFGPRQQQRPWPEVEAICGPAIRSVNSGKIESEDDCRGEHRKRTRTSELRQHHALEMMSWRSRAESAAGVDHAREENQESQRGKCR